MEETTLLYHCRALCMDEADTLLDNAFVVVQGAAIRSVGTERPAGEFTHEIDCGGHVLMPGLVNAHTHIPMTLLRGYGGGCDLQTWLNDWIFPAEAKLDDRAVKAGAGLALSVSTDGRTLASSLPEDSVRQCLAHALTTNPAAPSGPGQYCVDPAFVLDADAITAGAALALMTAR